MKSLIVALSLVAASAWANPMGQPGSYLPTSNPGAMPFGNMQQVGEQPGFVQPNSNGCSVDRNNATRIVNQNGGPTVLPPQDH